MIILSDSDVDEYYLPPRPPPPPPPREPPLKLPPPPKLLPEELRELPKLEELLRVDVLREGVTFVELRLVEGTVERFAVVLRLVLRPFTMVVFVRSLVPTF